MHAEVVHPVPVLTEPNNARPFWVIRYACLLLRGLSGMVISMNPASIKRFSTWSLNLGLVGPTEHGHQCSNAVLLNGSVQQLNLVPT